METASGVLGTGRSADGRTFTAEVEENSLQAGLVVGLEALDGLHLGLVLSVGKDGRDKVFGVVLGEFSPEGELARSRRDPFAEATVRVLRPLEIKALQASTLCWCGDPRPDVRPDHCSRWHRRCSRDDHRQQDHHRRRCADHRNRAGSHLGPSQASADPGAKPNPRSGRVRVRARKASAPSVLAHLRMELVESGAQQAHTVGIAAELEVPRVEDRQQRIVQTPHSAGR